MSRILLAAIAAFALVFAFAACGDDDDESADLDRYCEVVAELDALGAEEFEELEGSADATGEDFEDLQRELVEENEELFDEVEDVAPDVIRDEVETLVAATRAQAGLSDDEVSEEDFNAAEQTVELYEEENCGGDSGDAETDETTTTETDATDTDEETTTETDATDETTTMTETEGTTSTDDSAGTTTDDSGGVSPE